MTLGCGIFMEYQRDYALGSSVFAIETTLKWQNKQLSYHFFSQVTSLVGINTINTHI